MPKHYLPSSPEPCKRNKGEVKPTGLERYKKALEGGIFAGYEAEERKESEVKVKGTLGFPEQKPKSDASWALGEKDGNGEVKGRMITIEDVEEEDEKGGMGKDVAMRGEVEVAQLSDDPEDEVEWAPNGNGVSDEAEVVEGLMSDEMKTGEDRLHSRLKSVSSGEEDEVEAIEGNSDAHPKAPSVVDKNPGVD